MYKDGWQSSGGVEHRRGLPRGSFDDEVAVADEFSFDEIRHFGASIPVIAAHLLNRLAALGGLVPEERRGPLIEQAHAVLHSARESITNAWDRADVEQAAEGLARRAGVDISPTLRTRGRRKIVEAAQQAPKTRPLWISG